MQQEKLIKILKTSLVSGVFTLSMSVLPALASVNISGSNDTTGPNSENKNSWDVSSETNISIVNASDVENEFKADVQTGQNDIKNNTTVEDVSTGDINGDISVVNNLNTADPEIDVADMWNNIDVTLSNDTTGPNSENSNKVEISKETNVSVVNSADVENEVDIKAGTGHNDIGHNTTVGDISTGDINITGSTSNTVNAHNLSFDMAGAGQSVSTDFSNHLTGPNSENKNKLEVEQNLNVSSTNTANIENEVKLNADSGHNDIGHNTVVGDVSTGGVSFNYTISNVAN